MKESGILQLLENNKKHGSKEIFSPNTMFHNSSSQYNVEHVDQLEQEKKQAFKQGYQEGVEKAQQEWNQRLALLDNICEEVNKPLKAIDKQIQDKSVEIAIAVAKQIIRRELSFDSGQIVSAVKQAIELIPKDGEKINLHINPVDLQNVNEIFTDEDSSNRYNIIQDPTIEAGGCLALTNYSLVDLTINKQIASISAQIFGDQRNERN